MKKIILGIDLGTTNSSAFYLDENKKLVSILTEEGKESMPSIVAFSDGGSVKVGEVARRQLLINKNTITKIKSKMGQDFKVKYMDKVYQPEQISALILMKIKQLAEKQLKQKITDAVITVPAYFSNIQREKTQIAAKMAGLNPIGIVNEPTAASLSIQFQDEKLLSRKPENKILVYDFGGGTFDVSILRNKGQNYNVIATAGDKQLGGDNIDQQILNIILENIGIQNNIKINSNNPNNSFVIRKMLFEIEEMKKSFSTNDEFHLSFPSLKFSELSGKILTFTKDFTKKEFNSIVYPIVKKTINILQTAFNEANLKFADVDFIFLFGGSCKLSIVQSEIEKHFPKEKIKKSIDMDLSVGMGAAVYSSIISGKLKGTTIKDVSSISIGIANSKGLVVKAIPKNTPIPFSKEMEFHTSEDNQKEVTISIVEGENKLEKYCENIGKFTLKNLTPMPKGLNLIKLQLALDKNGILIVRATETSSNNSKEIKIEKTQDISKETLEKLSVIIDDGTETEDIIMLDRFSKIIDSYNKKLLYSQKKGDVKIVKILEKKLVNLHKISILDIEKKSNFKKIQKIVKNFNKNLKDVRKKQEK